MSIVRAAIETVRNRPDDVRQAVADFASLGFAGAGEQAMVLRLAHRLNYGRTPMGAACAEASYFITLAISNPFFSGRSYLPLLGQ